MVENRTISDFSPLSPKKEVVTANSPLITKKIARSSKLLVKVNRSDVIYENIFKMFYTCEYNGIPF